MQPLPLVASRIALSAYPFCQQEYRKGVARSVIPVRFIKIPRKNGATLCRTEVLIQDQYSVCFAGFYPEVFCL